MSEENRTWSIGLPIVACKIISH